MELLVDEFIELTEIKCEQIEGTYYWYKAQFEAIVASNTLFIKVDNDTEVLHISCLNEHKVPADKRVAVALFFTMVNYRLTIGNILIDLSDGEIRYTNNIDTEDVEFSVEALKRAAFLTLAMMDRYMPAVMRIIYADFTPKQALEFIKQAEKTARAGDDDNEFDTGSGYVDSDIFGDDSNP